jgi:hypothetical protein
MWRGEQHYLSNQEKREIECLVHFLEHLDQNLAELLDVLRMAPEFLDLREVHSNLYELDVQLELGCSEVLLQLVF